MGWRFGRNADGQMILVDSSVWIGYFNRKITPQTDWLDSALGMEIIIVGDLILVEVLQGFPNPGGGRNGLAESQRFAVWPNRSHFCGISRSRLNRME